MNTLERPALVTATDRQPSVSWTRSGRWLADAVRILRRAPVRLVLLPFLPIMIEILIQLVPAVGIALSKVITPVFGAWILLMTHDRIQQGAFAPRRNLGRLIARRHAVLALAIIGVAVFGMQCLVAMALGGPAAAMGLIANDPIAIAALGSGGLAVTLASAAVPMAVLFFVLPHLILSGRPVGVVLQEGIAPLRTWWPPVIVIMAISAWLLPAALTQPATLLVLVPVGFLVGYAGYRDALALGRA